MKNQVDQYHYIAASSDGKFAAINSGNKILLVDTDSFELLSELDIARTEFYAIGFINDFSFMFFHFALYGESETYLLDKRQINSSNLIESFDSFEDFNVSKSIINFTDSGLLIALEERKKIFLYDMNSNKLITEFETTGIKMNEGIRLISSFSGEMIAVITSLFQNYTVNFYNIEAKMNSGSLFLKDISALQQFVLSPKGNYFAYSDLQGLHVFRISNLKKVWEYRKMNPCDDPICFSFLDEEVIIVVEGCEIKKANFVNNRLEMCYKSDNEEIVSLHVLPVTKRILATLSNGDFVLLYQEDTTQTSNQFHPVWYSKRVESGIMKK